MVSKVFNINLKKTQYFLDFTFNPHFWKLTIKQLFSGLLPTSFIKNVAESALFYDLTSELFSSFSLPKEQVTIYYGKLFCCLHADCMFIYSLLLFHKYTKHTMNVYILYIHYYLLCNAYSTCNVYVVCMYMCVYIYIYTHAHTVGVPGHCIWFVFTFFPQTRRESH